VIQAVQQHEYESLHSDRITTTSGTELSPYGRLILLKLSSPDEAVVENTCPVVRQICLPSGDGAMSVREILGPAPASIYGVQSLTSWQILSLAQELLPVAGLEPRAIAVPSVSLTHRR